jgi:hypothetical protein
MYSESHNVLSLKIPNPFEVLDLRDFCVIKSLLKITLSGKKFSNLKTLTGWAF